MDKLKLTRDRKVVFRETGEVLAQLDGPDPWEGKAGRWCIAGEKGVSYRTAGDAMREIAWRNGLIVHGR